MTDRKYNGWSNYETWAVALWLDNEQSSYAFWRGEAERHQSEAPACQQVKQGIWSDEDAARLNLAEQLKDAIAEDCPLTTASLYVDLLHAALSEVDWQEIAGHLLEDVQSADMEENQPQQSEASTVIHQYTRADAIADGVLIDISQMANDAGISCPVAMTSAAWHKCVEVPTGVSWNDEQGRLWDVVSVMLHAMTTCEGGRRVDFQVSLQASENRHETIELYALCHPGDDGFSRVITVMLQGED